MYFKTENTVDVHDVDYNGVAKVSSLMRYFQSCAQEQLTLNGMSYDELKARGRAFILSKIKMEFTAPVYSYDRITSTTFPCESRGYSFIRCYALERAGITIGRAVSIWALIDTEAKSLVRVNNFDLGLVTHEPLDLTLNRFILPAQMTEVGSYEVRYTDIDRNRHMNNTAYPDLYAHFLKMSGKRIHTLSINYLNEARLGDKLTVEIANAENENCYIRTTRPDGKINTEAEILLADI